MDLNPVFEKAQALASSELVELGQSFKDLLNKELCLGMTRYVVRNGNLSEGFEKITPAQRYYQAIRECYSYANSIADEKVLAMLAQADLMDAQAALDRAIEVNIPSKILRAKAKVLGCQNRLRNSLVNIEDRMRQLDEFNKVRLELEPEIRARYPMGIEQSEPDSWKAVAEYRLEKKRLGKETHLEHVPMSMMDKAQLGIDKSDPELCVWLKVAESKAIDVLANGSIQEFVSLANQAKLQQGAITKEG